MSCYPEAEQQIIAWHIASENCNGYYCCKQLLTQTLNNPLSIEEPKTHNYV